MANLTPGQQPNYGTEDSQPPAGDAASGTRSGTDPTNELGQTPASLFGVPLPQNTGAPGSAGASSQPDPTLESGQNFEGISGLTPAQTASTGSPGTQGATNGPGGGDTISYTQPGSYLSGTYKQDTVNDSISGTGDWTQANDSGYGSGGPQLPGIRGNEPTSTGSGDGSVLRGGRAVGG